MIGRNCDVLRFVPVCFCATKTTHFLIESSPVTTTGFCTIIGDFRDIGRMSKKKPGTSQKRKPIKKEYGCSMVIGGWFIIIFWNQTKPSQQSPIMRILHQQYPALINRRCPILLHHNSPPPTSFTNHHPKI